LANMTSSSMISVTWSPGSIVSRSSSPGLKSSAGESTDGSAGAAATPVDKAGGDISSALLDVPPSMLEAHGAVSAQVARAMATGCRARLGASLVVSITGIAGPDGGTEAKPVGLAYIGLAGAVEDDVRRFVFSGDRAAVREAAAAAALEWLIAVAEAGASR